MDGEGEWRTLKPGGRRSIKKGLDEGYCRGMLGSGWFKTSFGGGHTRLVSGLDKGVEK